MKSENLQDLCEEYHEELEKIYKRDIEDSSSMLDSNTLQEALATLTRFAEIFELKRYKICG